MFTLQDINLAGPAAVRPFAAPMTNWNPVPRSSRQRDPSEASDTGLDAFLQQISMEGVSPGRVNSEGLLPKQLEEIILLNPERYSSRSSSKREPGGSSSIAEPLGPRRPPPSDIGMDFKAFDKPLSGADSDYKITKIQQNWRMHHMQKREDIMML